jgi:hypothetical protein
LRDRGGGQADGGSVNKITENIKVAPAENVIQAAGFADQIGLFLNRHLTVSWEHAQCIGRVQDIQGKFLERYSKWIRYHGAVAAYVWSIENGRTLGYHSHIFCHVPPNLFMGFKSMVPRWIDGEVDQSGPLKTSKITTIKYGVGVCRLNRLKGVTRYILKAANDDTAELFGIIQRPDKAGVVMGKRLGTSQNIGRKARNENLAKLNIQKENLIKLHIADHGQKARNDNLIKPYIRECLPSMRFLTY